MAVEGVYQWEGQRCICMAVVGDHWDGHEMRLEWQWWEDTIGKARDDLNVNGGRIPVGRP